MLVHPNQLQAGCVMIKSVHGLTNHPIIEQKTVISEKHIKVLQHFDIDVVEVADKLASGKPFVPKQHLRRQPANKPKSLSFAGLYMETVEEYKALFQGWQGGIAMDIPKVRNVLTPLWKYVAQKNLDILALTEFSTKQDYIYHHGVSVAILAAYLSQRLGYQRSAFQIGVAGLVMDSGMARLNNPWFTKGEPLSKVQYNAIKEHPVLSYRMIENQSFMSSEMKLAIVQHHERLDGSGYPTGVKGKMVHPISQILAIADIYHAMTVDRAYQEKQSPFQVLDEIIQMQYHQLDFKVVQAFISLFTSQLRGKQVMLSNEEQAEIVYFQPTAPSRPLVRLIN
ncbi:HD-GYP domain-containing protein, partial [Gracilibacillus alcaliphilus]|uniref:HD-GYP domain-containing protein n=1 Tax=Gracilibacillus alcaliphilus TaxID=1401441 RepID=UPI001958D48D